MRNTVDKLLLRVDYRPDGCWRWKGTLTTKGYGQVSWQGRKRTVHCLFYEIFIGPIPAGMTLDHSCRNRWCCNPRHVEAVTNHVNILRGKWPSANRELCLAGIHDITGAGAIYTDSQGVERCHECRLESKRQYRLRKAA